VFCGLLGELYGLYLCKLSLAAGLKARRGSDMGADQVDVKAGWIDNPAAALADAEITPLKLIHHVLAFGEMSQKVSRDRSRDAAVDQGRQKVVVATIPASGGGILVREEPFSMMQGDLAATASIPECPAGEVALILQFRKWRPELLGYFGGVSVGSKIEMPAEVSVTLLKSAGVPGRIEPYMQQGHESAGQKLAKPQVSLKVDAKSMMVVKVIELPIRKPEVVTLSLAPCWEPLAGRYGMIEDLQGAGYRLAASGKPYRPIRNDRRAGHHSEPIAYPLVVVAAIWPTAKDGKQIRWMECDRVCDRFLPVVGAGNDLLQS
jgi:hypothetical protein